MAQRQRRLRTEPLCRLCKEKGIVRASVVPDHIVPLSLGGSDEDSNIRCLCQACHDRVTAAQFNRTYRVPIGADGWPSENHENSTS